MTVASDQKVATGNGTANLGAAPNGTPTGNLIVGVEGAASDLATEAQTSGASDPHGAGATFFHLTGASIRGGSANSGDVDRHR